MLGTFLPCCMRALRQLQCHLRPALRCPTQPGLQAATWAPQLACMIKLSSSAVARVLLSLYCWIQSLAATASAVPCFFTMAAWGRNGSVREAAAGSRAWRSAGAAGQCMAVPPLVKLLDK